MVASNEWGRVDDDGTVYVRTAEGERVIGSWQAGEPAEGLAHYSRRYEDLATEIGLLEKRLESGAGNPAHTADQAAALRSGLAEAHVIGDIAGLEVRLIALDEKTAVKKQEASALKAQARAAAATRKEALAAEAEALSTSTQWKQSGDRLRAIIEEWKLVRGVDRKTDDALWKRFSAARDAFSKARGSHFAQLDKQREVAKDEKLRILKEAEELAASTDWAPTAAKMKGLMSQWKTAGRAPRETEDELWTKFRAAQDAFFAARGGVLAERDSEYVDNQKAKEALLGEAEKLDPRADLEATKSHLRDIQAKWEVIGHVPRESMRSLEDRMKAVERRVHDAEEAKWRRSANESNPLLLTLREAVTKAEKVLTKAETAGNAKKIAEARATVEAKREWLVAAEKSLSR